MLQSAIGIQNKKVYDAVTVLYLVIDKELLNLLFTVNIFNYIFVCYNLSMVNYLRDNAKTNYYKT